MTLVSNVRGAKVMRMAPYLPSSGDGGDTREVYTSSPHASKEKVHGFKEHCNGRGDFALCRTNDSTFRRAIVGKVTVKVDGRLMYECSIFVEYNSLELLRRQIEAQEERVEFTVGRGHGESRLWGDGESFEG